MAFNICSWFMGSKSASIHPGIQRSRLCSYWELFYNCFRFRLNKTWTRPCYQSCSIGLSVQDDSAVETDYEWCRSGICPPSSMIYICACVFILAMQNCLIDGHVRYYGLHFFTSGTHNTPIKQDNASICDFLLLE